MTLYRGARKRRVGGWREREIERVGEKGTRSTPERQDGKEEEKEVERVAESKLVGLERRRTCRGNADGSKRFLSVCRSVSTQGA